MGLHVIPLTPARNLPRDGRIIIPLRSDITDYGTPGHHLHPPLAKARLKTAAQIGLRSREELGEPPPAEECPTGFSGRLIAGNILTAPPQVLVNPSDRIPFPFIFTYLAIRQDLDMSGSENYVTIKIADDADTTGGINTTGTPILIESGQGRRIRTGLHMHTAYPQFTWPTANAIIKTITDQVSTAVRIQWLYSIVPLAT